jgi:hypothetical protein
MPQLDFLLYPGMSWQTGLFLFCLGYLVLTLLPYMMTELVAKATFEEQFNFPTPIKTARYRKLGAITRSMLLHIHGIKYQG